MDYWHYWGIRYTFISTSILCIAFTICFIVVEKLYKYLVCVFVLLAEVSFGIVQIAAIMYTPWLAHGHQFYDCSQDRGNYKCSASLQTKLCCAQAYIVHTFWLTGFCFSFAIIYSMMKLLNGQIRSMYRSRFKIILACFLLPAVIMTAPFIYEGYGPAGFQIITPDDINLAYLFCGWAYTEDFNYALLLNNSLPVWILFVLSLYCDVKIQLKKRQILRSQGRLNPTERVIIQNIWSPRIALFIWAINVVLRLVPQSHSYGLVTFYQTINTVFDLLPAITCIIFINYVRNCIPLKVFKCLGKSEFMEDSNIYQMFSVDN